MSDEEAWINKMSDESRELAKNIIEATNDYEADTILLACALVLGITIKEIAKSEMDARAAINALVFDLEEHMVDLYRMQRAGHA